MKIETKLKIGDTCWSLKDNKVVESDITEININVEMDRTIIAYRVKDDWFDESLLFATKSELLESL